MVTVKEGLDLREGGLKGVATVRTTIVPLVGRSTLS